MQTSDNSDTCQFWHLPNQAVSDTFHFWHFLYPTLRARTHGGENLPNNLVFWQIIPFWDANLQELGTFFAHAYGALLSFLRLSIPNAFNIQHSLGKSHPYRIKLSSCLNPSYQFSYTLSYCICLILGPWHWRDQQQGVQNQRWACQEEEPLRVVLRDRPGSVILGAEAEHGGTLQERIQCHQRGGSHHQRLQVGYQMLCTVKLQLHD